MKIHYTIRPLSNKPALDERFLDTDNIQWAVKAYNGNKVMIRVNALIYKWLPDWKLLLDANKYTHVVPYIHPVLRIESHSANGICNTSSPLPTPFRLLSIIFNNSKKDSQPYSPVMVLFSGQHGRAGQY